MAASPIDQNAVFVHDNAPPPPQAQGSLLALFSLKGKTAIVTGGGAGIGLSVAQGLAEAGANIALFYNTNEKAPERAAELEKQYGVKGKSFVAGYQVTLLTTVFSQGISMRPARSEESRSYRQ
jgi:sorbose reductase